VSATRRDAMPHRFPFRLVDRAETGVRSPAAVVLPSAGAFLTRGRPWSATLVAEALAQAILLVDRPPGGGELRLLGLDRVELHRELAAGDRLEVEVGEARTYGALRRYTCRAWCGGTVAATGEVTVKA
jgi:3-hydroxymyristoyl/3-hydroxydecanoyl-(acyl carrier protein) dehydratase